MEGGGSMTNFKRKLDGMMGDTSRQEARIQETVRERVLQQTIPKKRNWQVASVAVGFVVLSIFLVSSMYTSSKLMANEGRGKPYDPYADIVDIQFQRQTDSFSQLNEQQLLKLPIVNTLNDAQYIDHEVLTLAGQQYQAVVERQANIYDVVAYKKGDIVRTVNNSDSHLPIYNDEFYEIIALPGDRVVLQNGELTVNGKKVKSSLLKLYEEMGVTIAGGYDQLLNAREYLLLNHFPKEDSVQPATINAVHKIYGKVVGLAQKDATQSIYFDEALMGEYSPEQYFDFLLYDLQFGDGAVAQKLSVNGQPFSLPTRASAYFLEQGYREVVYISQSHAEIRYSYGENPNPVQTFHMYKQLNTSIWQWSPKEE